VRKGENFGFFNCILGKVWIYPELKMFQDLEIFALYLIKTFVRFLLCEVVNSDCESGTGPPKTESRNFVAFLSTDLLYSFKKV
jgi:hypothetical protein